MEYRRKRRVAYRKPPRRGAYQAYAVVFVAFFGVAYLIGASKVGTYVAKNWIAPVLRQTDAAAGLRERQTPAPASTPETVLLTEMTKTLTVPARTLHAVQIGVYAEKENANAQSAALQKIGAAGYVLEDHARFRVLASAYPTEEDARAVVAQLSEAGVESVLHPLTLGEKKLTLTGTPQQLGVMEEAAGGVDAMLASLYDACIAFDKEQRSVSDGMAALSPLQKRAQTYCETLSGLAAAAEGGLAGIDVFYATVRDEAASLLAAEDATAAQFSADGKRLYLSAVLALQ